MIGQSYTQAALSQEKEPPLCIELWWSVFCMEEMKKITESWSNKPPDQNHLNMEKQITMFVLYVHEHRRPLIFLQNHKFLWDYVAWHPRSQKS